MAKSEYSVDRNREDFDEIETNEANDLEANTTLYDTAIGEMNTQIQSGITSAKDYAEEQKEIAEENRDFTIQQIEQNKQEAKEGLNKETSGAYTDYQKQTNKYGANAEAMAAQGLSGSGYAESSKVSMYNTYQNRVSTALESYQRAVTDYNIAIEEAKLQNSSLLAEIAYNALKEELSLTLQGMQYKNTLLIEKANRELAIKQYYDSKWLEQYKLLLEEQKLALDAQQAEASIKISEEQLTLEKNKYYDEKYGNGLNVGNSSVKLVNNIVQNEAGELVDYGSILLLGQGNITVDEAEYLASQGLVRKVKGSDGVIRYRNFTKFTTDYVGDYGGNYGGNFI